MQFLELTHEQYDELCQREWNCVTVNGSVDSSAFLQWAIETHGLEIYQEYHIKIIRALDKLAGE